jgi:hypothetical protein
MGKLGGFLQIELGCESTDPCVGEATAVEETMKHGTNVRATGVGSARPSRRSE